MITTPSLIFAINTLILNGMIIHAIHTHHLTCMAFTLWYDMKFIPAHLFVHLCVYQKYYAAYCISSSPCMHLNSYTLIGQIWLLYPIKLHEISSLPVLYDMIKLSVAFKGDWLPASSYSTGSRAEANLLSDFSAEILSVSELCCVRDIVICAYIR